MIIVQYFRHRLGKSDPRPVVGSIVVLPNGKADGFIVSVEDDIAEVCLFEPKPIPANVASYDYKNLLGPLDMKRYFEKAKTINPECSEYWQDFVFPWDGLH